MVDESGRTYISDSPLKSTQPLSVRMWAGGEGGGGKLVTTKKEITNMEIFFIQSLLE